jgi:hypothetical protein
VENFSYFHNKTPRFPTLAQRFQALEKMALIFPRLGKFPTRFPRVWKGQGLRFPRLGKPARSDGAGGDELGEFLEAAVEACLDVCRETAGGQFAAFEVVA